MAFHGGLGPSQWIESGMRRTIYHPNDAKMSSEYKSAFEYGVQPPHIEDPQVEEADWKAYLRLMATLARGRSQSVH